VTKRSSGFVPLSPLEHGPPDPATALAEIRRIYFRTTRRTIEHDFAHAVELLKSLPDEETRQRAHVYMEGLAEMRREWAKTGRARERNAAGRSKARQP
jgi:hypothetical protein